MDTQQAMQIQELTLANLVNFDRGYFEALANRALAAIGADLNDRPALKGARMLNIQLEFKPVADPAGNCDGVTVRYKIDHKLPAAVSNSAMLDIQPDGKMLFRGLAPEDPSQQLLPMDDIPDPAQVLATTASPLAASQPSDRQPAPAPSTSPSPVKPN